MEIVINTTFYKVTNSKKTRQKLAVKASILNEWFQLQNNDVIIYKLGSFNLNINDYKTWFNAFFEDAKNIYNQEQIRSDREINDVFKYYEKRKNNVIAEKLIISIGNESNIGILKKFINNSSNDNLIKEFKEIYKNWAIEITNKISNDFKDVKIYTSILKWNNNVPYLEIIGITVVNDINIKNGLITKLATSKIFSLKNLVNEHHELKKFNKIS